MAEALEIFGHCAGIVRERDPDRYLSDLFAPPDARRRLFALHAFNAEVARVRDAVSEPMPGEIRLQWWRDAIANGESGGNPVAEALNRTIHETALPPAAFDNLLSARAFDLYDDPMPSLNDLEGYAGETVSIVFQLGAMVLAGGDPGTAEAAGHAGVAYALTSLLQALPRHLARGQMYLPGDLIEKNGVDLAELRAGRSTPALTQLLAELTSEARTHLMGARQLLGTAPPAVLPAFLPLALIEPRLRLLERNRSEALRSVRDISPWRRQWLIWRAARGSLTY
jgi:phytoene synthase